MYLFNHVDRRIIPLDGVLVDWGLFLKVLLPIWRPRPKIDDELVIAILEDAMWEGNRPYGARRDANHNRRLRK